MINSSSKNKIIIPTIIIAVALFCTAITATVNAAHSGKQVLISSNIESSDSFGKWNNTDYTNFYNVRNLFDNSTDEVSSWSQYGESGWNVKLQPPLNNNICGVEIDVVTPKNTPFSFIIGNNATNAEVSSVLDNNKEVINIDNCIKNVTALGFISTAPGNWTTLSEVKLFTNETGGTIPDPEPCPEGTHKDPVTGLCIPDEEPEPEPEVPANITKLTITNSTVLANITDSKVILNSSGDSQVIVNNAENPNTAETDKLTPMTDDKDKEEDEEQEEEDEEEEQQRGEDEDEDEEEDDKN